MKTVWSWPRELVHSRLFNAGRTPEFRGSQTASEVPLFASLLNDGFGAPISLNPKGPGRYALGSTC